MSGCNRSTSGLGAGAETVIVEREAGTAGIFRAQYDRSRTGINDEPHYNPVDDRVDIEKAIGGAGDFISRWCRDRAEDDVAAWCHVDGYRWR